MKKEKAIEIIFTVVFMAFVVIVALQYKGTDSLTKEDLGKIALAEINQTPPQTSLFLITQPSDGSQTVTKMIQHASKTLDLVIYELEDPTVEQALVDAKHRGVAVRVILQNIHSFGRTPNQPAYDFLQSQGVAVIWAPRYFALTHQKTLIEDGVLAMIMTFNLTPQYYASSRDFALLDTDLVDVSAISAAFNADWDGKQITASNGNDLVWSPNSADTLLALINSASKTLDVYNEEMADSRITQALKNAAGRGVDVRVDMTYATNWKAALNELAGAGVTVRTYASTAHLYIHAKAIIVDHKKAFVGSENFSPTSLDLNRELGILISRPDIVDSLETTFADDWTGSRPFKSATSISLNAGSVSPESTIVKLSKSGLCHPPDSPSYATTKTFTPYATIEECLAAGGQLPSNYQK